MRCASSFSTIVYVCFLHSCSPALRWKAICDDENNARLNDLSRTESTRPPESLDGMRWLILSVILGVVGSLSQNG